jgi:hypothetical protein
MRAVMLIGTLVTAGCGRVSFVERADAAPLPIALCERIPRLAATPMIDGILEPGLAVTPLDPIGWQSRVMPKPPIPDVPVELAIAYRADGLYFFARVFDPDRYPAVALSPPYCGDSIEVYIDHDGVLSAAPDYDATGGRQFIARVPQDDATPRSDGETYLNRTSVGAWQTGFVATPFAGGYTFEAFVDANAMQLATWSLASGMQVGIDLAFGLSTPDGSLVPLVECAESTRLGQFFMRIDPSMIGVYGKGAPYATATALCLPVLE